MKRDPEETDMIDLSEFGNKIRNDMKSRAWVFRGQHNPDWGLQNAYSRYCKHYHKQFVFTNFLKLLDNFLAQVSNYMIKDYGSMSFQQKIAFAQHHGLPTPFLDWSYSPYIALFFAASEKILSNDSNSGVKIWAMNVKQLDKKCTDGSIWKNIVFDSSIKFAFSHTSNFHSKRISRQLGCFTLLNFDGCLDEDEHVKKSYGIQIKSYTVQGDWLEIIRELKLMGISGGNMFDDFDHIARDVVFDSLQFDNN